MAQKHYESGPTSPVDLYLIFGKSSLKNQVRRTGFLVYPVFQKFSTDQQGNGALDGVRPK